MKPFHTLLLTALLSVIALPTLSNESRLSPNNIETPPEDAAPTEKKTIYRYVDSSGRIIFTDDPTRDNAKGAQALESHETNTLPAVKIPKKRKQAKKDERSDKPIYDSITLTQPEGEWDFQLYLEVSPELQEGDSFQVMLNGEATTTSTETTIPAPEMTPGTSHSILVNIIDSADDVVATSNAISISPEQLPLAGGFKRRAERVIRAQQMKTGR